MSKINIELVKAGYANGAAEGRPLTEEEKLAMIADAEKAFGMFLDALKVDWRNDPNSDKTPYRVAKAYVRDLWAGRYEAPPAITTFPSDGYDGMVFEGGIPLTSMCSHHHQTIMGVVHVAYIPGKDSHVIGLSKLNRLVEHFGRRGAIQEQLTVAIHHAVNTIIKDNISEYISKQKYKTVKTKFKVKKKQLTDLKRVQLSYDYIFSLLSENRKNEL